MEGFFLSILAFHFEYLFYHIAFLLKKLSISEKDIYYYKTVTVPQETFFTQTTNKYIAINILLTPSFLTAYW